MKLIAVAFLMWLCDVAAAQDASQQSLPTASLTKGAWELGIEGAGGAGIAAASNTQFVYAGGRIGRILSKTHFSGWRRGDFEWAVDFLPVYTVYTPRGSVYGGSFKPVIWQWNFAGGARVAPYVAAAGGVLVTTRNIPPGNTSTVNFTPQATFGMHIFPSRGRALLVEASVGHVSNADLGTRNPGYPVCLLFAVGYSWFKSPR